MSSVSNNQAQVVQQKNGRRNRRQRRQRGKPQTSTLPKQTYNARPRNVPSMPKRGKGKTPNGSFDPSDRSQNVRQIDGPSSKLQMNVPITVTVDPNSIGSGFLAMASYLLYKGFVTQMIASKDDAAPGDVLYQGLAYLIEALDTIAKGGTVAMSEVPQFVNVMCEAFKPKTVPFKSGSVAYSWSDSFSVLITPTMASSYARWAFGNVTDTGAYNDLMGVVFPAAGNIEAWNKLTKYFTQYGALAKLVKIGGREITTNDASCYARQYAYNGAGYTSTGVWFGDVECEVPTRCPIFSKFVEYDNVDSRVSRVLSPSAGDSLLTFGLPLIQNFSYNEYRNKYTPVYKVIDFEEIYGWLCSWISQFKSKYVDTANYNANSPLAAPLPFTQQDFRIMLRQALMAFFDTSHITQFILPRTFSSISDNGFAPFLSGMNCYGDVRFLSMMLPQLLQENLASLKMHCYQPPVMYKKNKNIYRFIPVLGNFINDTVATYQYRQSAEAVSDIFQTAAQTGIKLQDCTLDGDFVCVNNSFYQTVLTDWNYQVELATEYVSPCVAIGSDLGAKGMSLLSMTRFQKISSAGRSRNGRSQRHAYVERFLKNRIDQPKVERETSVERKKGDKKKDEIKALPVASLAELITYQVSTAVRITDEALSMYEYLVLPVQRTDDTGDDVLSVTMCSVETLEANSYAPASLTSGSEINGSTSYDRLFNAGGLCVTGTAGATSPTYISVIKNLSDKGQAGALANLLGGIISSVIPEAKGVIDIAKNLIPI